MAGVRRMRLDALTDDDAAGDSLVVGVVVAKGASRVFAGRRPGDGEAAARGAWTFTLRDSPLDTINVRAWGSPRFVGELERALRVGDVVDVVRPRVRARRPDAAAERYAPRVSSPFELVVDERRSDVTVHRADDYADYLPLLRVVPAGAAVGYFVVADALNNSQQIREDSVDLLVAVRVVFPTRMIKTKTGEEIPHRELLVMDQSTPSPLKIMLWDQESIRRCSDWRSRETILFMSDVKLEWNAYSKCIVGRVNSRTIITEDPHTPEAEALRVYAAHVPLQAMAVIDQMSHEIPDPNSIKTVMSVQQVLDRAEQEDYGQFTALMYVIITKIDLDGPNDITVTKCGGCSKLLRKPKYECDNLDCSSATGAEACQVETNLDIRVTLSDHTGSLNNCRLSGKFAEGVLNCSIRDILNMSADMRGQLKWRFLMERCAVRAIVMKGPLVSILSCAIADPNEVVSKLPIY